MTRVAVLGASGFLGRRVIAQLTDGGHEVVAGVRRPAQIANAMDVIADDFATADAFRKLLDGCSVVVNAASVSTPGTSAGKPLQEVEGNLRVTAALIEALQDSPDTSLVYISSGGSVYENATGVASREDAPVHPRSYHGAAKLAAEWLISAWCDQFGGQATAIRPSNIYGPGQPAKPGFGVIPAAFKAIIDNSPLTIWGDGSAARDYIYVDDVAALVSLSIEQSRDPGLLHLNASSGTSVALVDLLDAIGHVTGQEVPRRHLPSRSVDAANIAMDSGRAHRLFSWTARVSLHEGIERAWADFRSDPASA